MAAREHGGRRRWIAALVACLGCAGDGETADTGDAGCAWGSCDAGAPRCVATGIADGSWLTTDWEARGGAPCTQVPQALRDPTTPGRYAQSEAPIGEIRCEGLRPGTATLRARVRVRALTRLSASPSECHCGGRWDLGMLVVIEGHGSQSLDGLSSSSDMDDRSCRDGPDVEQEITVDVGADGRVRARIELTSCNRNGLTTCLFLRGTGFSVEQ
ncbi:MAG: hypothetical protein Q8S73_03385 [Deltaproteobacteria bacterium]|nr:hypothetical protein [Myxococcales bacterium]MDP3213122.1 hypothetical protein [Deltaproteobacteria bacterium]